MSVSHEGPQAVKRIDQNSEQGKALQQVVQVKLKDFLGPDYADDVLPLYIVVMLAHGNQADLVADNLDAFLGQAHAQLFVQWLFQHLAEVGDKYSAPDQDGRSSASSSHDGTSADKAGSEDGEASAMEQDNAKSSPGKHQQSSSAAQHGAHTEQDFLVPGSGIQSQATQQQPAAPADRRRSQRSMSQDRADERLRGRHNHRDGPYPHAQDPHDRPRHGMERPGSNRYDPPYRHHPERNWSDHHDRGSYGDYREGYSSRRYSPPARQNHTRQSPPYGDRGIRDPPRGHMRSRREVDDRDHYSRTDREQKRRRSDPMGDSDMNGHQPTRDDRGPRPQGSRMRSDVILAKAAEQRQQQQQQQQHQHEGTRVAPEPKAPQRGPSVRSVVQRVSPVGAEEEEQPDRMAAARSRGKQPIRLFERAMRQVAGPSQPERPSVFDRLASQAAHGNSAAAVTASAVVRRLRRSAAAAAAGSQGEDSSSIAALKQQLQRMEQEVTKLRKQQQVVLNKAAVPAAAPLGPLADAASVVVQNVHFSANPQILAAHFSGCGPAARVTILKDKMTGHPTGTAYVQFLTPTQAAAALSLTGSLLLQRPITIMPKPSKPSHALQAISSHPSMQYASARFAAQPYSHFGGYQSGSGEYTPRGRGRGQALWGGSRIGRGGRSAIRRGRGSESVKSNVYIRPGIRQ